MVRRYFQHLPIGRADFVRQSLTKFNKSTTQAREMKEWALRIL